MFVERTSPAAQFFSNLWRRLRASLLPPAGILLGMGILVCPLQGQPYRHLERVYATPEYTDLEEWLGRASWLRRHLLISTGLWPRPESPSVPPQRSNPLLRSGYSVQSVVLETLPGFYLTGNLYLPRPIRERHPGILSPHGHWEKGRLENSDRASVPGRAIQLARMGFVVFSYSMIGYNETKDFFPHRFDEPRYQLWGFSAMGLQLWNSLQALEFLLSLPEVDPERIGMTGASGGGTQTFLLTAVDERIRVAAPVNMISTHFQGGCICENSPLLRVDTTNLEIGALTAPRPLLLVSTSGDWTVNTPLVEFPAIRRIYGLFGAADRVFNVHLDYPHNYNRDSREAVYEWFSRWMLDQPGARKEEPFQVEEDPALLAPLPSTPASVEEVFAEFRSQARAQIEDQGPVGWEALSRFRNVFGTALRHVLTFSADSEMLAASHLPAERTGAGPALLIVHPAGRGESQARDLEEEFAARGWLVFRLSPKAEENWSPPNGVRYWSTYNPTPAARRIAAIASSCRRILERLDVLSLDLVGLDEAGPWTLLARALVPEVRSTVVDFPHFSEESDELFLHRLFIPLIRRAGDFRTAAALIVPSPLALCRMPRGSLRSWYQDTYAGVAASSLLSFPEDPASLAVRELLEEPLSLVTAGAPAR